MTSVIFSYRAGLRYEMKCNAVTVVYC